MIFGYVRRMIISDAVEMVLGRFRNFEDDFGESGMSSDVFGMFWISVGISLSQDGLKMVSE